MRGPLGPLQQVVAELWEQVAPGGSALVRTIEQKFGPEVASQMAGDYHAPHSLSQPQFPMRCRRGCYGMVPLTSTTG